MKMVFELKLPKTLSPQEEALQKTFARLKKQRKQLQLKAQIKLEQPAVKSQTAKKRALEENAGEATAKAKKLLKAGAIKVEGDQKASKFKRSANLEKKTKEADRVPAASFTPYKSTEPEPTNRPNSHQDSFAPQYESGGPKPGRTLYVRADFIEQRAFEEVFRKVGQVETVKMEDRRNAAFVTFRTFKDAEKGLKLNGEFVSGVPLNVEFARRQPADNDSRSWSALASDTRPKGPQRVPAGRSLTTYDDDPFA